MTMEATEMIKKLGNKLLGLKVNTSAGIQYPASVETADQVAPDEKTIQIRLLDRLGVIQLHEHWRN